MKRLITSNEFSSLLIGLSVSLLVLTSCSASETTKNSEVKTSDKTFIFRDGQDIYRVEFDGKRIASLYKNDSKIPDNEIDNYKDLIEYELKNLTKDLYAEKEKPTRIKIFIDKDKSENDTTEYDEEDFDDPMSFRFRIDDDFLKDMKTDLDSLMKDLKDKDFEVYINPDELREQMKEYKKYFKNYTLPKPPKIDMEQFHKEMKKFREQMKHHKLNIDSLETELRDKMKDLIKEQKKRIEIIELKDENDEYNKSESFVDELKDELIKDGYLDSSSKEFSFRMDEEKISVNNKELPKELLNKYKEIFRKHHGRNLNGQIFIEID
uniref:Lipoprotein n=1 Tax=Ignavibacterium album TaxID=591197 RepID=A0A832DEV5_9BACT